jgi:hypothetical protein
MKHPVRLLAESLILLGLATTTPPARANDLQDPCWSETAASNTCAVPNGLPANTLAANLYGVIHEIMGALKRDWDRVNPTVTSSGTNTITLAYTVAPAAYVQGESFSFIAGGTNTGAATLNVNGLGVKNITKRGTTALAGSEILNGEAVTVQYDGTEFQLVSVGSVSNLSTPVSVANGGTASAILTAHGVLLGEGTSALGTATIGTSGRVLTDNGAGADPTFQTPATPKLAVVAKTADYTIVAGDCGTTLILNSGVNHAFTLPADATAGNGCRIQFWDQGAGMLSLTRVGSDTEASSGSTSLATLVLSQGDAGSLTADGVTNGIWWWQGIRHYDSGQQTITSGGSLTLAHGLGIQPGQISMHLHCTTGEGGYSAGDELNATGWLGNSINGNYGVSVVPDVTNLNIRYGSQPSMFIIPRKDTGAAFTLTIANWKLILHVAVFN